jgi:hypothetical protein
MSSAAALLLAVTLGVETQLDAAVQLEAAVLRTDPPPSPRARNEIDLTALPRLGARVSGGAATLSALYSPRFSLLGVGPQVRREQLQEGELRFQLVRGPRFRLEGFGTGAAGRSDLIRESRSAPPGGTGTTTTLSLQPIDLERWRTGLALSLAPDRRTDVFLAGAVSQDGGTNAASRAVYPVARTVDGSAELRWSATRLDRLGALLSGTQARVASRRTDSAWASALGTWRHQFSRRTEGWSGAGAVLLVSRFPIAEGPERTTDSSVEPAAQLGVTRTAVEDRDVTGELGATLGASVDRFTGRAAPQADARASLRWPLTSVAAFTGRTWGTLIWADPGTTRIGQVDLAMSFRVLPRVHVELGGFGTWQRSSDPAVGRLDSYGAAFSVSLEARPARF